MRDCPRAEIRDLLPDYVHQTLDAELRAEVTQHLDGCAECTAELALLLGARAALSHAPAVDVQRISAAVKAIRPGSAGQEPFRPAHRRWYASPMRIAASIALLAVGIGGGSLYLGTRRASPTSVAAPRVAARQPAPAPRLQPLVVESLRPSAAPSAIAATTRVPATGITFGGGVSDLADSDIESLIGELGQVKGVLATEPEPSLPIVSSGRGSR